MAGTAAAVRTGLATSAVTGAFAQGGTLGGAAMGAGLLGGFKKILPTLGIATAVGGIANFFGNAIDATSNLNESANAVRVTFGDAADQIERLGSSSAARLGLAQVDFNSLAVRFSSFAEDIAGEGGSVGSIIDTLTTRGADFASVYNIDVAEALAVFQSGLSGEAEPLKRFGINLLDSQVSAFAYANGIAEVGKKLTEQEKIQARYGLLLQETDKVQGDFANTSDQLANQQRINAAKWEDSVARIGEALTPAATAFAGWVGSEENVDRLEKIVDLFVRLEPAISGVADGALVLADAISNNSLAPLASVSEFFDALEDGKVTTDEWTAWMLGVPDGLRNLGFDITNVIASWANGVIDMMNTVRNAAAGTYNFISDLFGLGNSISFTPIARVGTLSMTGPDTSTPSGLNRNQLNQLGFPGMAAGGSVAGGGWSWVGERGPELRYMPAGAEVIPNDVAGQGLELGPKTMRSLVTALMAGHVLEADGDQIARTATLANTRAVSRGAV